MPYRLSYLPAVFKDDWPRINPGDRNRIRRAIEQRLTSEPSYYGEPLRHHLKGFWKLRVGDYRVIYRIEGSQVWIIRIGHRKEVYLLPVQRFLLRS